MSSEARALTGVHLSSPSRPLRPKERIIDSIGLPRPFSDHLPQLRVAAVVIRSVPFAALELQECWIEEQNIISTKVEKLPMRRQISS